MDMSFNKSGVAAQLQNCLQLDGRHTPDFLRFNRDKNTNLCVLNNQSGRQEGTAALSLFQFLSRYEPRV